MYYIIKLNFQLLSPNKYPIYCNIRAKLAKTHPIFKPFHRLGYVSAYHTCSSFSLPKMPYHSSSDNRLNNFSALLLHGL